MYPFGLCVCIIFYFLFHHEVGVQTTLPWGMNIYESKFLYHPIFVYEIILALCIMGLLWMKNERLGNGKNISVFLIIEGFAHIIISLVSEQNSVLFGLSAEQIMSFCIISLGILLVLKIKDSHVQRVSVWLSFISIFLHHMLNHYIRNLKPLY